MKFKIEVIQDGSIWWEEYDEDTVNAQLWAEDLITWFNDTAQPGDPTRKLMSVELL